MLDSAPFVISWKPVKVKLKVHYWFLHELITLKRNNSSYEKRTWKAGEPERCLTYCLQASDEEKKKTFYGLKSMIHQPTFIKFKTTINWAQTDAALHSVREKALPSLSLIWIRFLEVSFIILENKFISNIPFFLK